MKLIDKREKEKQTVYKMIKIYCNSKHKTQNNLCDKCKELYNYASKRTDLCPFMEEKTFCSNCKIHCYQEDKRKEIKEVMRFSGPRMIFVDPLLAISHLIETKKEKRRLQNVN